MSEVKVSGPLFEGTLDVKGGLREGMDRIAKAGESLVRKHLAQRSRYRTAKYGHVADAVRSQVGNRLGKTTLQPDEQGARIYLGGKSAFLGPILEGGARQHIEPRLRAVGKGKRGRLVRGKGRTGHILAFMMGGGLIFRRKVTQTGTPAYHWREQAQAELEPQVQGILDRALGEALAR